MSNKTTIIECLEVIGVRLEHINGADGIEGEFAAIKKVYFKAILVAHPDKGGDASVFREIQTNWEVLRELYDRGKVHGNGFVHYFSVEGKQQKAENVEVHAKATAGRNMPSYEWFAEAAEEPVPAYRVEIAKSGRSACKAVRFNKRCNFPHRCKGCPLNKSCKDCPKPKDCKDPQCEGKKNKHCLHTSELIEKDEIRFGSMVEETGTYVALYFGFWNFGFTHHSLS